VLDELILSLEEFNLQYVFLNKSTSVDGILDLSTCQITFKELTKENLEISNLEN